MNKLGEIMARYRLSKLGIVSAKRKLRSALVESLEARLMLNADDIAPELRTLQAGEHRVGVLADSTLSQSPFLENDVELHFTSSQARVVSLAYGDRNVKDSSVITSEDLHFEYPRQSLPLSLGHSSIKRLAVSNSQLFQEQPTIASDGSLQFRPSGRPGYEASSVITIFVDDAPTKVLRVSLANSGSWPNYEAKNSDTLTAEGEFGDSGSSLPDDGLGGDEDGLPSGSSGGPDDPLCPDTPTFGEGICFFPDPDDEDPSSSSGGLIPGPGIRTTPGLAQVFLVEGQDTMEFRVPNFSNASWDVGSLAGVIEYVDNVGQENFDLVRIISPIGANHVGGMARLFRAPAWNTPPLYFDFYVVATLESPSAKQPTPTINLFIETNENGQFLSGQINWQQFVQGNDFTSLDFEGGSLVVGSHQFSINNNGAIEPTFVPPLVGGLQSATLKLKTVSDGHQFFDGIPSGALNPYAEQQLAGIVGQRSPAADLYDLRKIDPVVGRYNINVSSRLTTFDTIPLYPEAPYVRKWQTIRYSDGTIIPFSHNFTTSIDVTANIRFADGNQPPFFTSEPGLAALAGLTYNYDANALDPESDPISFVLGSGPMGMTINPQTGVLQWTPSTSQLGPNVVTIRAIDAYGAMSSQVFTIAVSDPRNSPPQFTSTPITEAVVGTTYSYFSTATDSNGDSLVFTAGAVDWPNGFIPNDSQKIQFNYINQGNDQRGHYTWTVPAELTGRKVQFVELVTDGFHAPVSRTIEVAVVGQPQNHAPIITSEPSRNYQAPPDVTAIDSNDDVTPKSITVSLAEGQEIKLNVSINDVLGGATADIVIALDLTGSMHDAVSWLSAGAQSVVDQIDQKLNALGLLNNRYGLVVFNSQAQRTDQEMAIAIGAVNPASVPSTLSDIPLANSENELWGSVEQLKLALRASLPNDDDELGQLALKRIFESNPHELKRDGSYHEQYAYKFRDTATTSIILISDDEVTDFDPELQTAIKSFIVGDDADASDDVVFATVLKTQLMGDDGLGNQSTHDIIRSPGWDVDSTGLVFDKSSTPAQSGFAVLGIMELIQRSYYFPRYFGFESWSMRADIELLEPDTSPVQKMRLVFGFDLVSQNQLPSHNYYVEVDAKTNVWTLNDSFGWSREFTRHSNAAWPEISPNQLVNVELRLISNVNDSDRLDLFIDGRAIASQSIPRNGQYGFFTKFVGFGASNSNYRVDKFDVSINEDDDFYFQGIAQTVLPTEPTPRTFRTEADVTFRRVYANNFGYVDGSSYGSDIFGIAIGGKAYLPGTTAGSYDRVSHPDVWYAWFFSDSHYIDLARAVNGSVWNIETLRGQPSAGLLESFSNAFIDTFSHQVLVRTVTVQSSSAALVDVTPISTGQDIDLAEFEITLRGTGASEQFDLNFVRKNNLGTAKIGAIPVWMTSPYSHEFQVSDFENDEPYLIAFDPDFKDSEGRVITHGATLVDSGRSNLRSDRLIWNPPSVTTPTDFQFRVIAIDSAGQVGRKDWTVRVFPEDLVNTPPSITSGNALPAAQELRSYRTQIVARDVDPQDQGNLRYYLVPKVHADGSVTPVPKWLKLDRNTGLLTGKPGTADVGTHSITIEVLDGRFVRDPSGVLRASKATKTFSLEVLPRDAVNTPPYIEPIADFATRFDKLQVIRPKAIDTDADNLVFSLTVAPAGMLVNAETGEIRWVPSRTQAEQSHPVTLKVFDGTSSFVRSFNIAVGLANRSPQIVSDLPDWSRYADYDQPLEITDPDGDLVSFRLVKQPPHMTIDEVTGRIVWPRDNIIPGKHLIRVRAIDNSGGFTERDYYVSFRDNTAPLIVDQPSSNWRVGLSNTMTIHVLNKELLSPTSFTLNSAAASLGFSIDYGGIQYSLKENVPVGSGYYSYSIPIHGRPRFEGAFELVFSATNANGISKATLPVTVNPFVGQSTNRAPVFGTTLIGPFEKDKPILWPLDVHDPDGNQFTVTPVSPSISDLIQDNKLFFQATAPGLYYIPVKATENEAVSIALNQQFHSVALSAQLGTGWIMYSSENVLQRFGSSAISSSSVTNFLAVRFESGQWQYDNGAGEWKTFSPRSDDLLLASIDFANGWTSAFQGQSGYQHGVAYGYVSSNLQFYSGYDGLTVMGDTIWLTTPRTSYSTLVVAVLDNATPAIRYLDEGQALKGLDYALDFEAVDANPGDYLEINLNQTAIEAGLKVAPNGDNFQLKWSKEAIDAWIQQNHTPGALPIQIEVVDNHGARSSVSFTLPVRDPAQQPEFRESYDFRISTNRPWEQPLQYLNAGGQELYFTLTSVVNGVETASLPPGLEITTSNGTITWNPPDELLWTGGVRASTRKFNFNLYVHGGGLDEPLPLSITIVDPTIFFQYKPEFDETVKPPTAATVGQTMVFQPSLKPAAAEFSNESVVWTLEEAPAGMKVDRLTGRIEWTPTLPQLGIKATVLLRAASTQGAGSNLRFVVEARNANAAPRFNTTFPTVWEAGRPVNFAATAIDPEGHQLSYSLTAAAGSIPSGLIINSTTGVVSWANPVPGSYDLRIRAQERFNPDYGVEQRQFFTVFSGTPVNIEPLIIGNPQGSLVTSGNEFSFTFSIADNDQASGVPFTYSLVDSAPATVDANGRFRWTPPESYSGAKTFRLAVTDVSPYAGIPNNTRYLTFQLDAIINHLPVFKSSTAPKAYLGLEFVHRMMATDEDGDTITYSLEGAVPGMTITGDTGEVRWYVPPDTAVGSITVTVVAKDSLGGVKRQPLVINVSPEDLTPPALTFYMKDVQGNIVPPNSEIMATNFADYDLWIDIKDNLGKTLPNGLQNGSWYLSVANTPLSQTQLATAGVRWQDFNPNNPGDAPPHSLWKIDLLNGINKGLLEINLQAYDSAGNIVSRYVRYYVDNPASDSTAKILNINEHTGPITDRFEVMGNAREDGGEYDLKLSTMDDPNDFVYLARNQAAIVTNSVIGVIDATLIPSGQYRLYLEVRCSGGCITEVDERIIEIQNVAKVGNFELAFSDLNATLGGVPIPLVRTYNSGRVGLVDQNGVGGFKSDFGPGWNLNLLQSSISVSHPKGTTTRLDEAFAQGTRVFVTLPSGEVQRFTFAPVPTSGELYIPLLLPDPEFKSELYLDGVDRDLRFVLNKTRNDGTYLNANDNKESIPANFGSEWILKTQDGLLYHFDLITGKLVSIETSSGARIDITEEDGGRRVLISTRNTGSGNEDSVAEVKKIVITRDLLPDGTFRIKSIDDAISTSDLKVQYTYGTFNPSNGSVNTTVGDTLAQVQFRDGTKSSFTYSDPLLKKYLTSLYDNANFPILSATYYADVNNDGTINDADTADDRFGRLKSTSNSNGAPTNFGFNFDLGNGLKVKSTNISGTTIEEVVDARGKTMRTVTLVADSTNEANKRYLAVVSRYNLRGLLVAQSKPFYILGSANRFTQEPAAPATSPQAWASTKTYDASDRPLTVSDSTGGTTTYTYDDKNGVQTITDPHGVTSVKRVDPSTGRLIETYTTRLNSAIRNDHITFDYDAYGNQTRQWLNLANGSRILQSESFYDSQGYLAWIDQPSSPRQYRAYDENGLQELAWQNIPSPTNPGQYTTIVDSTFNPYAGLGNPIALQNAGTGSLLSARFTIVGTTPYNDSPASVAALRLKLTSFSTDSAVQVTSQSVSIVDPHDQVIESRTLSRDSNGQPFWYLTRTLYDSAGRVQYQTDSFQLGLPTEKITGVRNYYDLDSGRLIKTERLIGLNIAIAAGTPGRGVASLVGTPNVQSYSTTGFDALGRTIVTTEYPNNNPLLGLSSYTIYNSKGKISETRQESWDAAGTGKVTFITRTVYDDQDRVLLQTDPYLEGNTVFATKTLYDNAGRAFGTQRLKGVQTDIDSSGQTSLIYAPEPLYQTASYYDINRVARSVDAEGNETAFEYDAFGRQIATIGPEVSVDGVTVRHRTETIFDERGRTIGQRSGIIQDVTGAGKHDTTHARLTEYAYDDAGRLVRTTYDDGSFAEVRYDDLGRKIAESKQVVAGTQLTWVPAEHTFKVSSTGAAVPTRYMEYDAEGRLRAIELPAVWTPETETAPSILVRPRYTYTYSVSGQLSSIVDPNGHETRFQFDQQGRQIARHLPMAAGTDGVHGTADDEPFLETNQFDDRGRELLHVAFETPSNAENNHQVHEFNVYDDLTGRLKEIRYYSNAAAFANSPGTPAESKEFSYDDYGRVVEVRLLANGVVVRTEQTTYDEEGRVATSVSSEGSIRYGYDKFGRMITKEWSSSDYVSVGDMTYENLTQYAYDKLGRLSRVIQINLGGVCLATPDATQHAYDLEGSLDRTQYQNGLVHDYTYDSLGRLDLLTHWLDVNRDGRRNAGEPVTASFDYEVRADGKRTRAIEKFWNTTGAVIGQNTYDWEYDAADRLVSENLSSLQLGGYHLDWVYDLAGNRASQFKHTVSSDETTTYTYDANDRLKQETTKVDGVVTGTVSYAYNKTQQISKSSVSGGVTTTQAFEYDLQGRLKSVTTTKPGSSSTSTYSYDSSGTRVGSLVTTSDPSGSTRTEFLTDTLNPTGYSQVLSETVFDGSGQSVKKTIYTIGLDQISQTVQERGPDSEWEPAKTEYFGTDGHGSVRVLLDLAGAIVQEQAGPYQYGPLQIYHFDAYGNLLGWDNAQPLTNYLYSGEAFDFNIGQQYLRARFYDPSAARFTGLDPFAGNPSDPQSFHKYAYVHGDPIQGIDPSGEFFLSLLRGVGTYAAAHPIIFGAGFGGVTSAIDTYLETGSFEDAAYAGGVGALLGGLLGVAGAKLGPVFATQLKALSPRAIQGIFGGILTINLAATGIGIATARNHAQGAFRGALGAIGVLPFVNALGLLNNANALFANVLRTKLQNSLMSGDDAINNIGVLSRYLNKPNKGTAFSGALDEATGTFVARPSGGTTLANNAVPDEIVPQAGGHLDALRSLKELVPGMRDSNALGFVLIYEEPGEIIVNFTSGQINSRIRGWTDRMVPAERRQQIIDAVAKATGFLVKAE